MEQGDIWLLEEPNEKPRPSLIMTRPIAIPLLTSITVAPLTRTIRGVPTEIALGPDDGVRYESVASCDNLVTVSRANLTTQLGRLRTGRWHEVCAAMRIAIDC